ncbi:hypothetical protein BCV69DRAFT_312895 [Microstroma glucosiphilum]|uniref:Uncharacterized protein n=1 Tax=Pseudomicrostroma glucosiphilum TaxID=1684307 RepID=A0A316U522_9BASI|nr:hypothetical protein BCV69DRAFT_312895 [Pseudomicrostroma glucosiphilum]PWN20300.1 hypothetical protein BCV69DRAFT_312895 [Pseudomicrostroma glucosiphilum]
MSSFFDSLNFHREPNRPSEDPSGSNTYRSSSSSARVASHGSSSRASTSSAVAGPSSRPYGSRDTSHAARGGRQETVSARRSEANSSTTTADRPSVGASAIDEDVSHEAFRQDEGPRVFWDVPPSTFIRDWAKANPPDQEDTRRAGEVGGSKDSRGWRDDAWTDRLLRSAAASDGPAPSSRGGKWSRQASTASTTSTASNSTSRTNSTSAGTTGGVGPLRALKGRSSTINRRSKSLRNAKPASGFRRHVSTSAVLDESKGSSSNSHPSALAALCGGKNQAERVNKLLADLGLAFQEESGRGPDYEDEDGGEAAADVSMDSIHTVCDPGFSMEADSVTPGRSKATTPAHTSSGKTLTAGNTPQPPLTLTASQRRLSAGGGGKGGIPNSSWERTLTFPPSGSPATGGPQFRTGEAMSVTPDVDIDVDVGSDDEDGFWDEALLADLPLLSGIEEDQEGYFSGGPVRAPSLHSPQQTVPLASPEPKAAIAAAALGKRRDPPTPSPDEKMATSVAEISTASHSASVVESRSPSPTKMQRWSRASSRGTDRTLPEKAAQLPRSGDAQEPDQDAVPAAQPAQRSRTRSAAAAAAAVEKSAARPVAVPAADQASSISRGTSPEVPTAAARSRPLLRSSTAATTRQPSRVSSSTSPFKSTDSTTGSTSATSSARRAASPATFYGASPSRSESASASASTSTTTRSLTTGMTTSRPAGLSRRSAGMSNSLSAGSGMTLLRGGSGGGRRGSGSGGETGAATGVKASFKMPSRRALPTVPPHLEVSSAQHHAAGETETGTGTGTAEDDSFGDLEGIDASDLDLEEIEKVMSANGY